MSTEPALLKKAAMENWFYGMSARANVRSGVRIATSELPLRVTVRRTRDEYMFSGIRHIAAGREPCRHLRSAPRAAVTHAGLRRMTGCDPIIRERSLHPRPCGVRWTARLHFDMKGTDLKGARVDDHASSRQGWRASVSCDAKGGKGLPND